MTEKRLRYEIEQCGADQWNNIVKMVLRSQFRLTPVQTDGPGDGGVDFALYGGASRIHVAIQVTVQQNNLDDKIRKDIDKVSKFKDVYAYHIFVKRSLQFSELKRLEDKYTNANGPKISVFGCKEVAAFIFENRFVRECLAILGKDAPSIEPSRLGYPEVLLHTYLTMSEDRQDLFNEIYDQALICKLYEYGELPVSELIEKCSSQLLLGDIDKDMLRRRVDALRSKSRIDFISEQCSLPQDERDGIRELLLLYSNGQKALEVVVRETISECGGGNLRVRDFGDLTTILARCFISNQFKVLESQGYKFRATDFSPILAGAEDSLRGLLLKSGVSHEKIDETYLKLVEHASCSKLILKLAEAVLYVAIRAASTRNTRAFFMCDDWVEVDVVLDASVAMPYLLSKFFGGVDTDSSYYGVGTQVIDRLIELGAKISMPLSYFEECAMHLAVALRWNAYARFESELQYAENAYVAHYFRLKIGRKNVPECLESFIKSLSQGAIPISNDGRVDKQRIISDLLEKFERYGVYPREFNNTTEMLGSEASFAEKVGFGLKDITYGRDQRLIDHDIDVIKNLQLDSTRLQRKFLFLSWDSRLMSVARDAGARFWCTNPAALADVLVSNLEDGGRLLSLANQIASTVREKDMKFAGIMGNLLEIAGGKANDWEMAERIKSIKKSFFEKYDAKTGDEVCRKSEEEIRRIIESA